MFDNVSCDHYLGGIVSGPYFLQGIFIYRLLKEQTMRRNSKLLLASLKIFSPMYMWTLCATITGLTRCAHWTIVIQMS